MAANKKSGIKGIHWDKRREKWLAAVSIGDGVKQFLGRFNTIREAEAAILEFKKQIPKGRKY